MSVLAESQANRRLIAEDPTWSFLRSDNVWFAAPILRTHLTGSTIRMAASDLFDLIDADLDALRYQGHTVIGTARSYCEQWRRDGILIRRSVETSREETFELSPAGHIALQFVDRLDSDRTSVTQSRLATIQNRLRQLVRDTDPDVERRIAALESERERIDAEIDAVRSGEALPADAAAASESARDISQLASELPTDFARVRSELESINRSLRTQLVEEAGHRGTVLSDVWRGVDHLAESEAGRSFDGFASMLLDTEAGLEFETNITELLGRDFVDRLDPATVTFLRRLVPMLQDRAAEVDDVMTNLTRSLRRFVQSSEFAEDRSVAAAIRTARALAVQVAAEVPVYERLNVSIARPSVELRSVGSLRLHDPALARVEDEVESHTTGILDAQSLRVLAREADIDMKELAENVNAALAAHRTGQLPSAQEDLPGIGISDVLGFRPATQGIGSVIGLMDLALRHGSSAPDEHETLSWVSVSGAERSADALCYRFTEPIPAARRTRRTPEGPHAPL
ncbi:DUF3375 domain-containing protein [Brevibacterium luteolum]|uniref:DUF3375 domain-containing protein n=1 Tax=Brevibacterium luteolum TaxID=199591 RepID=UPI003879673F